MEWPETDGWLTNESPCDTTRGRVCAAATGEALRPYRVVDSRACRTTTKSSRRQLWRSTIATATASAYRCAGICSGGPTSASNSSVTQSSSSSNRKSARFQARPRARFANAARAQVRLISRLTTRWRSLPCSLDFRECAWLMDTAFRMAPRLEIVLRDQECTGRSGLVGANSLGNCEVPTARRRVTGSNYPGTQDRPESGG